MLIVTFLLYKLFIEETTEYYKNVKLLYEKQIDHQLKLEK